MEIIRMENIEKTYNTGKLSECRALRGISVQIQKGEWVSVCGKSGSGKSTFLHIAGLIDKYSAGSLYFMGECMDKKSQLAVSKLRKEKIGFVLQDFGLLWDMSVYDNIATPLCIGHVKAKECRTLVRQTAEQFGVAELLKKKTRELSGGQCQRVAIARAVIKKPEVILADEPTGALDKKNAENVMELFDRIHREGTTIIMVTHDMEIADCAQRKLVMVDGRFAEG